MRGYKLTVNLTMADSQRAAREFVLLAIKKTGWTGSRLAQAAGVAPSTINRFLNNDNVKHTLSGTTLSAIAAAAGLPPPFGGASEAPVSMRRLPFPESGEEDLYIMGSAVGGEAGVFDLNGEAIGTVPRPTKLKGVPRAYAVYMRGTSMYPKYEDGQLLYIDPHKPVRPGNYVVVEFRDHRAFVKRFVRRANGHLYVMELAPEERELDFDDAIVLNVHKIVHADEL